MHYHAPVNAEMLAAQCLGDALDSEVQSRIDGMKNSSSGVKDSYTKDRERLRQDVQVESTQKAGPGARFPASSSNAKQRKDSSGQTLFANPSSPHSAAQARDSRAQRWQSQSGVGSWKDKYVKNADSILQDNIYIKGDWILENYDPLKLEHSLGNVDPILEGCLAIEMALETAVVASGVIKFAPSIVRGGIELASNPEIWGRAPGYIMKEGREFVSLAKEKYSSVVRLFGRGGEEALGAESPTALKEGLYHLDPKKIRFTQPNVSPNFTNGGSLNELISDLRAGKVSPYDLPPIQVVQKDGKLFSIDNRRLLAFNASGVEKVPVEIVSLKNPSIADRFFDRFKPISGEGNYVVVVNRSQREAALGLLEKHNLITRNNHGY